MILRAIVKRHNFGTNGPAALTGRPEIPGSIPGSPFFASVVQKQDARMTPVRCGAGQDLESRGASPRSWHQSQDQKSQGKTWGPLLPPGKAVSKKTGSARNPAGFVRAPISARECGFRKPCLDGMTLSAPTRILDSRTAFLPSGVRQPQGVGKGKPAVKTGRATLTAPVPPGDGWPICRGR